jgi:group I intron endonuclease
MKPNGEDRKSGIYCIRNLSNNKVYIGKSKNIYKRIHQHLYDLKNGRKKNENQYLMNAWNKYGNDAFEYFVLEFLELDEGLLKDRELYWMEKYNSTDRDFGYNLRKDTRTNLVTHLETSLKISTRLKKEWSSGIRDNHGVKLKESWKNDPERKEKQSLLFSRLKTKYSYILIHPDGIVENCTYKRLIELKLNNVFSTMQRKKVDTVKFKGYTITKLKI